jgi:cytochrome c-type biogenesis protein CcmH
VTSTILLYALLLALAAGVMAFILAPLFGRGNAQDSAAGADSAAVALDVLRERRRELETALAHLPAESAERRSALAEFAAQATVELPAQGPGPASGQVPAALTGTTRGRTIAAVLIALLLAVPTAVFYGIAGMPEAAAPEVRKLREPANLDELVEQLRKRLATQPDELEGWVVLGRSEMLRGQLDAAREAFERALVLAPRDPQVKVDLADALAQSAGANLDGRPITLIREALADDPRNAKALALAGAWEFTQGNTAAALGHWRALLQVLPPQSPQAGQIAGFIADLEAGRRPGSTGSTGPAAQAGSPPATGATTPPAGPAASAAPASDTAAHRISGRIELDPALAARVAPSATLFVVARLLDADGRPSGPPLAVLRARAADLPLNFSLDDSQAMSPAARLSGQPAGARIAVVARISSSGDAAVKPGDLQGRSAPVTVGSGDVSVRIDRVAD